MPELQHVTADTSLETISEILDRDAGLIIDNVIPKKTISRLRSQLKPYLDQALEGKDEFSGFKTRRIKLINSALNFYYLSVIIISFTSLKLLV